MSVVSQVLNRCRSSATTVNQLNQAIIALENIITPAEARSIEMCRTSGVSVPVNTSLIIRIMSLLVSLPIPLRRAAARALLSSTMKKLRASFRRQ
jgi:hypothetical protein